MNYLVITGCSGGNIGQEFANYHACWKHAHRQIALVSENGIALFLVPGKHRIQSAVGMKCSLLPLGEPCASVTTTGLKWNLGTFFSLFILLICSLKSFSISNPCVLPFFHHFLNSSFSKRNFFPLVASILA